MRRWSAPIAALIAAVLGLACGYGYTRYRGDAPVRNGTTPGVATTTGESAVARTTAAQRTPRRSVDSAASTHPLRARAAGLPPPARP
ncbi:hypothetical protein, partial [Tahibacter caeni]|uniref:hypothetical protein n=1 Tax=Tahibacter caeni TaxID=1453545 RepID=UPI00214782E7